MPEHFERHASSGRDIRDIVLGMSDGLTVPFALAAGISGAVASTRIIVTAGGAEIVAGAISMALGGYLAARTEMEHYQSERKRELRETQEVPHREVAEVREVFAAFGFSERLTNEATSVIVSDRERWVEFMMRFELNLEKPQDDAAPRSAVFVGSGYAIGGIIPLLPYVFLHDVHTALIASCVGTCTALAILGAWKAKVFHALDVARGAYFCMHGSNRGRGCLRSCKTLLESLRLRLNNRCVPVSA